VCNPSTWTATDHRPTTTVDLYRAVVSGPTEGTVTELVDKGVIKLDKVATINLPRKTELQGW
jgi:branched-chain amino acid transport system substrate-binding protein